MKRDLHFEMIYPHPIDHVWRAITSSEAMSQWLMPNDFLPILGHRFQFRTKPAPGFDGVVQCEVLELVPPERLVYSWTGGGVDTRLIWSLKTVPEGTSVVLDHVGFKGLRGMLISGILGKGWGSKILTVNLPAMLSKWSGAGVVPDVPEAECYREKSQ
jgi:uncharacterized protein YndB with AHSA1/START domain